MNSLPTTKKSAKKIVEEEREAILKKDDVFTERHSERNKLCLALSLGCLAGLTNGYNYASLNILAIENEYALSDEDIGILTNAILFGATISAPIFGWFADIFGRRYCAIFGETLLIYGALSTAFLGCSVKSIMIYEFIKGLGCGICATTKTLLVSELCPAKYRGRILTCWNLAFTLGNSLASALSSSTSIWRVQILLGTTPAFLMLFILYIRRTAIVEPNKNILFSTMHKNQTDEESQQTKESQANIINRFSGLFAVSIIAFVSVLPGSTPFGSDIGLTIQVLGITKNKASVATFFSICGTAAVFFATFIVDSITRTFHLTLSALLTAFFAFLLAQACNNTSLLTKRDNSFFTSHIIFFRICFLAALSFSNKFGAYSIFNVVIPEIFPSSFRGFGVGFAIGIQHAFQAFVLFSYPILLDRLALHGTMNLLALILLPLSFFILFFIQPKYFPALQGGALLLEEV